MNAAAAEQDAVPWRNRLAFRLSAPILFSLVAVFVTLPGAGYFFAKKEFLSGLEGQISLLASSINSYDGFYRFWMETNAMPVVRNFEAAGQDIAGPEMLREVDFSGRSGSLLGQQGILVRLRDSRGRYHIWHWRPQDMRWENVDEDTTQDAVRDDMADILRLTGNTPGWHTVPRRPGAEPDVLHGEELAADDPGTGLLFSVPLRLAPPLPAKGLAPPSPESPEQQIPGEIYGALTLSVSMAWFEERISVLKNLKDSAVFLHTPTAGWTLPVSLGRRIPDLAAKYNALSPEDKAVVEVLRERMSRAAPGSMSLSLDGREYVAVFMPLSMRDFMLGVLQPRDMLLGDLDVITRLSVLTGGVLLFLALYVLRRLTLSLLRPLVPLRQLAARLSQGDLGGPPLPRPPFRYEDEPARLWKAAERLRQALARRVRDLTLLAVTRERLSGELSLARTIQQHLLPPVLPQAANMRVSAVLERAREVCGGTYDCFFLDPRRVCVTLGGVNARGVPAALSMSRVAPLIQELLLSGFSPAKALEAADRVHAGPRNGRGCSPYSGLKNGTSILTLKLNKFGIGALPQTPPGEMISPGPLNRVIQHLKVNPLKERPGASRLTLFAGVLDLTSGSLTWAAAGQRPPYLLSVRGGLGIAAAFPASAARDKNAAPPCKEHILRLEAGDCLLFCTDRLPDIVNSEGEPFGEARLEDLIINAGPDPDLLTRRLRQAVLDHTGGRLGEDLVLLALRWTGGPGEN